MLVAGGAAVGPVAAFVVRLEVFEIGVAVVEAGIVGNERGSTLAVPFPHRSWNLAHSFHGGLSCTSNVPPSRRRNS